MRSIIPVAAVLVALCASTPASACSWFNQAYDLGPGVYAAGHGVSQEAVSPVSFDNGYIAADVVDDHSPHVYFVLCIERPGDIAGQCSATNGDTEIAGIDRVEASVSGAHGLAHLFVATLHVSDDGSTQTASTGRAYFYFTSDCVSDPPRVGPGLGVPSI